MSKTQTSNSTRTKHLFSERHARGWIVGTIVTVLLMVNARALLVVALISAAGDIEYLDTDARALYFFDVAMVCIALIAASRRMAGITIEFGKALAVGLKMTVVRHPGKHAKGIKEIHRDVQFRAIEEAKPGSAQDDETRS